MPMQKACKNCSQPFAITNEDIGFYQRLSTPMSPPTHCPDCRTQRRLGMRNESNLYLRTCDFTGEKIISLYSPDKPYKVYKEEVWQSDQWDAMNYGRDYDFTRPFFEQFRELELAVPRRAMHQDGSNENCDYIAFGLGNKNGYLLFSCFRCEDCYYSTYLLMSRDACDSLRCLNCELIYECIDCDRCYNSAYCTNSTDCRDSYFLDSCKNCTNCIGCKNLRNKEYYIYNEPVSKEAFETYKKQLFNNGFTEEKKKFDIWKMTLPTLYSHIENSENCTGDYIENSKNCHACFDTELGAEDCKYCQFSGWQGKDMMDCSFSGLNSQLIYEMIGISTMQNSAHCYFCRTSSDAFYCQFLDVSTHCFGSVGLKHKQYCILNKQYTKEEYEVLMPRIIEHMKSTGEWGEFFPLQNAPFAYNETIAQIHFPLTREAALAKKYSWKDAEENPNTTAPYTCTQCSRGFKIITQEEAFYKKTGLPSPTICPRCRHQNRMHQRNPYRLYSRACAKCSTPLETSYAPEKSDIVYCEKCYLEAVY